MRCMRWIISIAVGAFPCAAASCSTSGASASSAGGYATLCPTFNDSIPTCPLGSDAGGCNLGLGDNCSVEALPQAQACSGMAQCQARIGPLPECSRVDAYICSCIDGHWSCDDCAVGATLCRDGSAGYVLPDGR